MKVEGMQLPLTVLKENESHFRVLSLKTKTMTIGRVRSTGTLATEKVDRLVKSEKEIKEVELAFLDAATSYAECGVQYDGQKRLGEGDDLLSPDLDAFYAQSKFKDSLSELSQDKSEYETISIVRNLLSKAVLENPGYRAQYLRMVEEIKKHYEQKTKKRSVKSA